MDFDYPFGICILLNPNSLNLAYDKLFYFRFIYAFDINENEVCMIKLSTIYRCSMFTVKRKTNFFRLHYICEKNATEAVWFFFYSKVPEKTLGSFLKHHRSSLTYENGYTKKQVAKLFPGKFFLIAMLINIGRTEQHNYHKRPAI